MTVVHVFTNDKSVHYLLRWFLCILCETSEANDIHIALSILHHSDGNSLLWRHRRPGHRKTTCDLRDPKSAQSQTKGQRMDEKTLYGNFPLLSGTITR